MDFYSFSCASVKFSGFLHGASAMIIVLTSTQ